MAESFSAGRRSPVDRAWWLALAVILCASGVLAPRCVRAQMLGSSIPSAAYFGTLHTYWDGDYRDALRAFQDEWRGGIRNGTNRWVDSICYYTMVGECYYQMGQHQQALAQYTSALQLYYAYSNWMMRVQFPPGIAPANMNQFKLIPWGQSTRQFVLGQYRDSYPIPGATVGIGNPNQMAQAANAGAMPLTTMMNQINVQEIVRCTTLAMRRRLELMGPACVHDELTNDLITVLSRNPGVPNHWSECWIDLQLGVAYRCGGKDVQAKGSLERSLLAAGQYDHPLTGMAFLELGRLALAANDFDGAASYFAEASYSAAFFMDPTVVEEALRYGQLTHLLANRPGVYPALGPATLWAKANNLRQMNVSMQLLAAENSCILGQTQAANTLLASAGSSIGRRAMSFGKIGARFNYISALVAYQQANVTAGDKFLSTALAFQQNGSLRLFHIALGDTLYGDGSITARVAMDIYNEVLRDSTANDWATDPLEALSVMMVPHVESYEHWFDVAVERKDHERLLEISELARRHRFLSTLDFGGRFHCLRWLLEGPEDALDQESKLQRQDILNRYTRYGEYRKEAEKLREELKKKPLVSDDTHESHALADKRAKLAEVSESQEILLREIAVRREPCAVLFPPFRATKEIKASLPEGAALLSFFSTPQQHYAILLTREKYGYWKVPRNEVLAKPIMKLLQGMGNLEANRDVTLKELESETWKDTAKQIFDSLTKESRADFKKFNQLIVVPEGMLWYLPFEALTFKVDDQLVTLGSKLKVAYAPLASLAVGDWRPRRTPGQTAVVVGKLIQGGDGSVAQAAFDSLNKGMPGLVALKPPLPHDAATLASLFDGLIVLNDIQIAEDHPYDWSPLPADQKGTGALANWFDLPWGGPDFVILPSFHTAAERAVKKSQNHEPGQEMFLSVCGLMANGARTILLSRWRTGGRTSVDLVREFLQELPQTSAADAWQRSVVVVSENTIDPTAEPRVRLKAKEEPPKSNHPFFWAGFMLVDTGALPQEQADEMRKKHLEAAGGPAGANNNAANKPQQGFGGGANAPGGNGAVGGANAPRGGGFNAPGAGGAPAMRPGQANAQQQPVGGLQGPPIIGDQPQPPGGDEAKKKAQRKPTNKKTEQAGAPLDFDNQNPAGGDTKAASSRAAKRAAAKANAAKKKAAKEGAGAADGFPGDMPQ